MKVHLIFCAGLFCADSQGLTIFFIYADDEKVALAVLCKTLTKKGIENAIIYVYEECKVNH